MEPHELETVITLWHETCADTYGFIETERSRTLEERRSFFRDRIAPACAVWVAVEGEGEKILAFLALRDSYIDRLYVHPTAQRRAAGAALLGKAQELSPRGLELHTHQKNGKARAFYEKHGFRAVRYSLSPAPENEPDVEYHWRPEA